MGMKIDGIAASQHIDSSGELLHIEGHDITDLVEGKGQINWEHRSDSPEDIIGQVTYAKKIMKKADCDTDRQKTYWEKVKAPFVYIVAELFDDEHHPGAVAAAAMLRYCQKRKIPMIAGFSIEGSTLQREGYELKRSVGRRVAMTLRPCNKTAISDIYDGDDIEKTMGWDVNPAYKTIEVDDAIFEDVKKSETLEVIREAIEALKKTLTAGSYNAAPSTLTQGSALQVESLAGLSKEKRAKLAKIVATWDGKSPVRMIIKAAMPEVSDQYIDHFEGVAHALHLKKSQPNLSLLQNKNASFLQDSLLHEVDKIAPYIKIGKSSDRLRVLGGGSRFQYQSPVLGTLLIKLGSGDSARKLEDASRYYEVARNFFRIMNPCPVSAYMKHPDLYNLTVGVSMQNDHNHLGTEPFNEALMKARQTGKLQKLAIVDLVLGHNTKRRWSDLSANGGEIIHVNNGPIFSFHQKGANTPDYYTDDENAGLGEDMVIPQVKEWLDSLDPTQLYMYLVNNTGANPRDAQKAKTRLEMIKQGYHGKTFNKLFDELADESSSDQIHS